MDGGCEEPGAGRQSSTVVVVDDDADIRDAVREVLEEEGYRTLGAADGEEALGLLHSSPQLPQLILLDLTMPVKDGWQFLLEIDEDPELHRVPVALMSAHRSVRRAFDKEQSKYGFTRLLLPKPLNLLRLLSIVESVCSKSERL
jgi:CheY-like chemotaxis protein